MMNYLFHLIAGVISGIVGSLSNVAFAVAVAIIYIFNAVPNPAQKDNGRSDRMACGSNVEYILTHPGFHTG